MVLCSPRLFPQAVAYILRHWRVQKGPCPFGPEKIESRGLGSASVSALAGNASCLCVLAAAAYVPSALPCQLPGGPSTFPCRVDLQQAMENAGFQQQICCSSLKRN